MYIVGSGPSEPHAHIDLDRRVSAAGADSAKVLDVAHCDGHWSVVAAVDLPSRT